MNIIDPNEKELIIELFWFMIFSFSWIVSNSLIVVDSVIVSLIEVVIVSVIVRG